MAKESKAVGPKKKADSGVGAPSPSGSGSAELGKKNKGRGTRPRGTPLYVWATAEEREALLRKAELAGMSQSQYLRTAGLNHPIRSQLDYVAVRDLVGVAGDLGRLGGLFKLWLSNKAGTGVSREDVVKGLADARELQAQIKTLLAKL